MSSSLRPFFRVHQRLMFHNIHKVFFCSSLSVSDQFSVFPPELPNRLTLSSKLLNTDYILCQFVREREIRGTSVACSSTGRAADSLTQAGAHTRSALTLMPETVLQLTQGEHKKSSCRTRSECSSLLPYHAGGGRLLGPFATLCLPSIITSL